MRVRCRLHSLRRPPCMILLREIHGARTGELHERGGTGQPGTDISPFLQFGNVADGDIDDARGIAYVADGDGGPNNRIVGKCCCSHFARRCRSAT